MNSLAAKDLAGQLLFCFVEFCYRRGRNLTELDLPLRVDVVVTTSYAGQLAGVDSGNVGELSTCSVLRRNDGCNVGTFACRLFERRSHSLQTAPT